MPRLELLRTAITRLGLSARAYHRLLEVARTIADLAAEEQIGVAHLGEAIQYRALDRPRARRSLVGVPERAESERSVVSVSPDPIRG